jgi:hypothetical protein
VGAFTFILWVAGLGGAIAVVLYVDSRARRVARLALAERNPAFTFAVSLREILDEPERWRERLNGLAATVVVAEEAVEIAGTVDLSDQLAAPGNLWYPRLARSVTTQREPGELRRQLVVYLIDRNSEIHTIAEAPLGGDTGALEGLARQVATILGVPFRGLGD